jgi:DNA-binding CsgD family transcriptional regulator
MENQLLDRLSDRQRELLELVSDKVTTSKALAVETGLAPGTIDNLLQNAAQVLQVQGRAAAAQRFRELQEPKHAVGEAVTLPAFIPEMSVSEDVGSDIETEELARPQPPAHDAPQINRSPRPRRSVLRIVAIALVPFGVLVLLWQAYISMRGYPGCTVARYLRAAPIASDETGYDRSLDRDGDGIACE